jgi:galactose mutarotase-like enzyme
MPGCRATDQYTYRGIDTAVLANEHLRVEVLTGKGADVRTIRDARTDVNVLFEAPHEWYGLERSGVGVSDRDFEFLDRYPGGWQDVLPVAGEGTDAGGAPFAQHGESSIVPWEATVVDDGPERAAVSFAVDLSRYPFRIERELSLTAGEPTLRVDETVHNDGEVPLPYSWLHHVALGEPLVAPEARLETDAQRVLVDPDHDPDTRRLPKGASFDWPACSTDEGDVDLREFPPADERVHDIAALTGFEEGHYVVSNPELDLAVTVEFDPDLFEYVWYWGAFGGFEAAPFFGRNYNVGLEPCTSRPVAGLDAAVENGTANRLTAGESVETSLSVSVGPATDG